MRVVLGVLAVFLWSVVGLCGVVVYVDGDVLGIDLSVLIFCLFCAVAVTWLWGFVCWVKDKSLNG
jgi:hypothetical protein